MKKLAILGASGHGKVIAEIALATGWQEIVFYDDDPTKGPKVGPWRVAGNTEKLLTDLSSYDGVIVAIGQNATRLDKQDELEKRGGKIVSLIHPRAAVSPSVTMGTGCAVMANAAINADARIGAGCIINTGAVIDHDCKLGDGVHISPGAHLAGGVTVGTCAWIGMGANVKQLVRIGSDTVIGMGAAVLSNILDSSMVAGIPARKLK